MTEKEAVKISKFLSLVLRHQPETIGICLDDNGWTDVDELIEKATKAGFEIDRDILQFVVDSNSKKRFTLDETKNKIRANQGHSVEVELGYESQKPPGILYHGTGKRSLESILQTGLEKRSRHHVHLTTSLETAINVGQRHGEPFVFEVLAQQMFVDGFQFFQSVNGVWLVEYVPVRYFKKSGWNK
jgi:putative RNA 2'-phosphotransferase